MKKFLFCLFAAVGVLASFAADVNRKRDVVYYYYDSNPVLWPKSVPYSPEELIRRTSLDESMSAKVKPDTCVYVPMSNFAGLPVILPSNEPAENQPEGSSWLRGVKNAIPEIRSQGKANDPISAVSRWARKNNTELLIGLCVNSTLFQGGYQPLKPPPPYSVDSYLFNPLKIKHPEWLMGTQSDNPPMKGFSSNHPHYAGWCQVDYGQPEIRKRFADIATEIINGYDIDGVMIDFCRGPSLFRSVAWGGHASSAQCQQITEMMGVISAAAKAKGCIVAVHMPDSLEACKNAGMDVKAWFANKFADLLFIGGPYELWGWSKSAEMAKSCGVPFYASIEQGGIHTENDEGGHEDDQRLRRFSPNVYRARVTEARVAGAKGIMYTAGRRGWYNPWWAHSYPGDFQPSQENIRLEDKRYFVNYRHPNGAFVRGMGRRKALVTNGPHEIKGTAKYEIFVADDFETLRKEGVVPKCYLTTIIAIPVGYTVEVSMNGKPLKCIKKRAGSQIYPIPSSVIKFGSNEITVSINGSNKCGLVPMIGNLGIDVLFKGELDALKKPGNEMTPLKDIPGKSAGKSEKKGARK